MRRGLSGWAFARIRELPGCALVLLAALAPAYGSVEEPERGVIAVIDRAEIEISGAATLWHLLTSRDGFNVYGINGLSLTRGVSYLLDGRRTTGLDFALFPPSAVERIEIAEERNANISHHTPGVIVNIVTKRGLDAVETSAYAGRPAMEGADTHQGGAVWSGRLGRGRALIAAGRVAQEEIREADRDYTRTKWVPGGSFVGTQGISTAGNTVYIQGIGARALGDCDPDIYVGVLKNPKGRPGEGCAYSYADAAIMLDRVSHDTLLVDLEHPAGDRATAYLGVRATRSEVFDRAAPTPDALVFEAAPGSAVRQSLIDDIEELTESNFPADNGITVDHRFIRHGNRETRKTSDDNLLTLGLHGEFANGIEYDMRGHYQRTRSLQKDGNYLGRSAIVEAIESGAYDIVNPRSTDPAHRETVRRTAVRRTIESDTDLAVARTELAGAAFDLPAGPVRWTAAGTFVRQESRQVFDYRDGEGRSHEASDIAGAVGQSSDSEGTAAVLSTGATLPVSPDLDLALNGSRTNYDYAGYVLDWTFSGRYRLSRSVTLRARWSEWENVPSWNDLYAPKSRSFPYVCDTRAQPCSQQQVEVVSGGNPGLGPSESSSGGIGATFSIDGFSIAADWLRSETDGLPATVSPQRLVDLEVAGQSLPAGVAVDRDAAGNIDRIAIPVLNSGELDAQYAALRIGSAFEAGWAALDANLAVVRRVSSESRVAGLVQPGDSPRHRAHASLKASRGDVTASWNGYLVSSYWNETRTGRWSRWTGHDIALHWQDAFGVDGLAVAGGVLNVGNDGPAFNPASPDIPAYTHDSRRGRTYFLRAAMSW